MCIWVAHSAANKTESDKDDSKSSGQLSDDRQNTYH